LKTDVLARLFWSAAFLSTPSCTSTIARKAPPSKPERALSERRRQSAQNALDADRYLFQAELNLAEIRLNELQSLVHAAAGNDSAAEPSAIAC
jgi:hypothetical protein